MANNAPPDYKQTAIWKEFKKKSNEDELPFVKKLVEHSLSLLSEINKTFPYYTNHYGVHQFNILKIMGDLLGDEISKLTSLECAFLILSSYYHDIGMVYKDAHLENLSANPDFEKFIKETHKAEKEFLQDSKNISPGLKEWYCRWAHANRVYVYLDELEKQSELKWNNKFSLREKLGVVCESHNWSAKDLLKSDFAIFYNNEADLRFCAVLLRLADYLDFDYTRASKSLYDFLNLDNPESEEMEVSKGEWDKHMSSDGFKFNSRKRNEKYEIKFVAYPSNPIVEKNIKNLINDIRQEIDNCRDIINSCSEKWRSFELPIKINEEFLSQGYKFGDFQFNLNQNEVLNLLTGDNLYNDKYIFVRELLQNALDTSRYFEFRNKNTIKAQPIKVSTWNDEKGYQWIRIDDYGIGMNEDIIKKFFLKIGDSYYKSDEFIIEKLKLQEMGVKDFTPISRFGIGILSCFMVGDRVEVSTKMEGVPAIRLSIKGLHGFYTLQTNPILPNDMPKDGENENGYRQSEGTSIAVRLDPSKEDINFNLKDSLKEWLFCPPVDVLFDGEIIGRYANESLDNPLCDSETEMLDKSTIEDIEGFLEIQLPKGLGLNMLPVNFTSDSFNKELLKGQGIILNLTSSLKESRKSIDLLVRDIYNPNDKNSTRDVTFILMARKIIRLENGVDQLQEKSYSFPKISKTFNEIIKERNYLNINSLFVSHNGIGINYLKIADNLFKNDYYNEIGHFLISGFATGFICLYDSLRPKLSVSRENIEENIGWHLWSNLEFASKKIKDNALNKSVNDVIPRLAFEFDDVSFENLSKDNLLNDEKGWESIYTFKINDERINLTQLKAQVKREPVSLPFYSDNFPIIYSYLFQSSFDVEFEVNESNSSDGKIILKSLKSFKDESLNPFPPLMFMHINNSALVIGNGVLNLNHPFCKWYTTHSEYLKSKFNNIFRSFLREITILQRISIGYGYMPSNMESCIDNINKLLERTRRIESFLKKYKPDQSIKLKASDMGRKI